MGTAREEHPGHGRSDPQREDVNVKREGRKGGWQELLARHGPHYEAYWCMATDYPKMLLVEDAEA